VAWRYAEAGASLSHQRIAALNKEAADLEATAAALRDLRSLVQEAEDLEELASSSTEDPALRDLALTERAQLSSRVLLPGVCKGSRLTLGLIVRRTALGSD
jgi:protein subunit release factor A